MGTLPLDHRGLRHQLDGRVCLHLCPSGLGVREAVLVALFSTIVPTEQIAAYSIVHRLLYTFVEVSLGLIGFFVQRKMFPIEAVQKVAAADESKNQ
jgi:hypothetical protein